MLDIHPFASPLSGHLSYLLIEPRTRCCAVVDPHPDTAEAIEANVRTGALICEWVLSTGVEAEDARAAREFAERFLCARTAGGCADYDLALADDERMTLGHAHGRAWVGASCVSYVFDDLIVTGCPNGAMSTVGRMDRLKRLQDDCTVVLGTPLDASKPFASHRSSLGELRALAAVMG